MSDDWDRSDNATRVCQPNGTWANYSNYRSCVPLSSDFGGATPEYGVGISEDTTTIYFTGYTVSIVALTLAIWIFIHFKLVEFLYFIFSQKCTYISYSFILVNSCTIHYGPPSEFVLLHCAAAYTMPFYPWTHQMCFENFVFVLWGDFWL